MSDQVRIQFRKATHNDLAVLKQWDEDPSVIDSDPMGEWNWEAELAKDPDWREFLMAEAEGVPIGFLQIIDPGLEETHYWGDIGPGFRAIDIWIGSPAWRNRGMGTAMMREALKRCFAPADVHTVLVDPLQSNTGACRFYERLGFEFVEDRMFDEDACRVYQLSRATWESRVDK
ncbi:MAG: GNAT family N-acetyltransferase [Cyclobacteriaceae bacterium]|nr:GNAT family N-acetyltransferase [Cyclobacteriaceae bacterium]